MVYDWIVNIGIEIADLYYWYWHRDKAPKPPSESGRSVPDAPMNKERQPPKNGAP